MAQTDDKLIDRIYEAAVLPDLWPAILDDLVVVGNGHFSALFSVGASLPLDRCRLRCGIETTPDVRIVGIAHIRSLWVSGEAKMIGGVRTSDGPREQSMWCAKTMTDKAMEALVCAFRSRWSGRCLRRPRFRHALHAAAQALLFVLTAAGPAVAAEPLRLRVTMQLPLSSHLGANLLEFTKAVAAQTGGALAFEITDSGKLYPESKLVDAVSSGAIEMAIIGFNQFSAKAPSMDVVQQPFLLNYDKLVWAALSADSPVRAIIDQSILVSAGVRPLWWQGYGTTVFFSRGSDATDPSRIKGQRVRVLGNVMAEMVKLCGGEPVILSAAAMTKAMKDGQVDMIMVGASSVEPRGLWEVSDTITRTEHAALEFVVVINEGVWQSLTEPQRQVMTGVAREVERRLRQKMAEVDEAAYSFARSKGMTIRSLTPDEISAWRACSAPVLEHYMSNADASVKDVLAAYGRLRMQPCCNEGPQADLKFTRH